MALVFTLAYGCTSKKHDLPPPTFSEAQKKFETKCREDFDLEVTTRQLGRTLYVYLPTDKPLFDYSAQKENTDESPTRQNAKFTVQYLDGGYDKAKNFSFEYDIIDKLKTKEEDYGYATNYTDSFSKQQNNLFTAIANTFLDAEASDKENSILFFVIVITDIKKGIESKMTFYFLDLKRYMSEDLPYEEYMKRFLVETKGGQSMIGDEVGTHIEYKDVAMPDFLSKQIINRIQYKFQRSECQPTAEYDDNIIAIAADTLRYYHFVDFGSLHLDNLRKNKKFTFDKTQLDAFGDDKPQDAAPAANTKGKLIHIIFENGKAKIQE